MFQLFVDEAVDKRGFKREPSCYLSFEFPYCQIHKYRNRNQEGYNYRHYLTSLLCRWERQHNNDNANKRLAQYN